MYAQPPRPIAPGQQYNPQDMVRRSLTFHWLLSDFDLPALSQNHMKKFPSIVRRNGPSRKLYMANVQPPSYLPFLNSVKKRLFSDIAFPSIHNKGLYDDHLSLRIELGTPKGNQCAYAMRWMPFMQYHGFPPVTG